MTSTSLWLSALLLLIVVGESAHVRLAAQRGVSPIASAAAAAFMLSLPTDSPLSGVGTVVAGLLAVLIATLVGTAVAGAIGLPTTPSDLLGRMTNATAVGILALLLATSELERDTGPVDRWIYALALWLVTLAAAAARAMVLSLWAAQVERRAFAVVLQDELATFGMVSLAIATTAVTIVLARDALGLWAPIFFSLPLALTFAAARRYAQTRETYRETIVALARLTDIAGYTTTDHARRVADLSVALAKMRGLPQREIDTIEYAALLHDLGQVALDEPIPGGATVLAAPRDQERIARDAVEIVRYSGVKADAAHVVALQATPFRLMQEDNERIPLGSRIVKLANALDDLAGGSREPGAVSVALERIQLGLGYEYDPELVDDLIRLLSARGASRPLS